MTYHDSPGGRPAAILDFLDAAGRPERRIFTRPLRVLTATTVEQVPAVLDAVSEAAAEGRYAVGYVAYEAAPAFDPANVTHPPSEFPLACFGIYAHPDAGLEALLSGGCALSEWKPDISREAYDANIDRIRERIAAGETYQVNHTLRLRARFEGDPLAFYTELRDNQPNGYCACLDLGRFQILSASPELFFRRTGDRIEVRPMKGTAARGRWTEEDDRRRADLAASEKDRAENLMIVDLLRNDLGRLARPGTVAVSDLFTVERYPTVHQMTSGVTAELMPGTDLRGVFTALFPSGSVTGAPKISTMRLITALESAPRQIYCGAIGYVAPGGDAVFSVAIRTVLLDSKRGFAEYGVGGGITWDSAAAAEYAEAITKSNVLRRSPVFDLLETLRLEAGRYALLERHLSRLADSSAYFDRPLDLEEVRGCLERHAAWRPMGTWRVRLRVDGEGRVQIESSPLDPLPDAAQPVCLAASPIDSTDRFLFHKTTWRGIYEAHTGAHPEVFDVLLWNENREVTEFTRGNVVVEIDGRLWTPPRACGLLAGTLRAELLEFGKITERALTVEAVECAARVWFINSVRDWVPVALRNHGQERL